MKTAPTIAALLLLVIAAPLAAGDSDTSLEKRQIAQAARRQDKTPSTETADAQAEADVLAFVHEHHAELADVLATLKESRPKEYQKALRDLSRVRDRLAQMKKNDNGRYELELAVWKSESRIQLLAARLQMGSSEQLQEQLREALSEQVDRRIALLKHEQKMAQQRLERVESQLEKLEKGRSQAIERQLQQLTRSRTRANNKKPDKKPASNRPAAKTAPPQP